MVNVGKREQEKEVMIWEGRGSRRQTLFSSRAGVGNVEGSRKGILFSPSAPACPHAKVFVCPQAYAPFAWKSSALKVIGGGGS